MKDLGECQHTEILLLSINFVCPIKEGLCMLWNSTDAHDAYMKQVYGQKLNKDTVAVLTYLFMGVLIPPISG